MRCSCDVRAGKADIRCPSHIADPVSVALKNILFNPSLLIFTMYENKSISNVSECKPIYDTDLYPQIFTRLSQPALANLFTVA